MYAAASHIADQREPRNSTTISNYAARTSARAEQKTEIAMIFFPFQLITAY